MTVLVDEADRAAGTVIGTAIGRENDVGIAAMTTAASMPA
jgi:hypothetical protein